LLLCSDFEFALQHLGKRLLESNSLAIRALCFVRSVEHRSKERKTFMEATLGMERVDSWEYFLKFYESCCNEENSIPQVLEGHQLPKGLLSPFTGTSAPVEQIVLEKRFCSGRGPTAIQLKYRRVLTTKKHHLCEGDIVEAFADGAWSQGTIMEVSKDSFGFRDSMGNEHMDILPEYVRPWPQRILLKPDSIVNDMTCFCMNRIFNYVWRHSFIPQAFIPCALDVEVLPAGPEFGFMEYVDNCQTAQTYDWAQLYEFNDMQIEVFLRTAAGSLIAGHVLGIGDRHQDNIMLREVQLPNIGSCTQFFQLDFKHYLGVQARIDASPIAIPHKMKEVLESLWVGDSTWEGDAEHSLSLSKASLNNRFDELVALCGMAFRVLRRSSGFVMHFVRLLNLDDELKTVWENYLMESLCFSKKEDDAVADVCEKVRRSANTVAKMLKDVSHGPRARAGV